MCDRQIRYVADAERVTLGLNEFLVLRLPRDTEDEELQEWRLALDDLCDRTGVNKDHVVVMTGVDAMSVVSAPS